MEINFIQATDRLPWYCGGAGSHRHSQISEFFFCPNISAEDLVVILW